MINCELTYQLDQIMQGLCTQPWAPVHIFCVYYQREHVRVCKNLLRVITSNDRLTQEILILVLNKKPES
jgi:hypothetical protein